MWSRGEPNFNVCDKMLKTYEIHFNSLFISTFWNLFIYEFFYVISGQKKVSQYSLLVVKDSYKLECSLQLDPKTNSHITAGVVRWGPFSAERLLGIFVVNFLSAQLKYFTGIQLSISQQQTKFNSKKILKFKRKCF